MFFLSHAMSPLLLVFFMLVSVMFAGLLEVTFVVDACGAILLTSLVWGDTYCDLVMIV